LVPGARHIAVGPQGAVTFVGTCKDKIYAVSNRAKSGIAEGVKPFASTIDPVLPNRLKGWIPLPARIASRL